VFISGLAGWGRIPHVCTNKTTKGYYNMKSLTMAAVAVLFACSLFAQDEQAVQVYDFKAVVKNSNVDTKVDRKTNKLCDYKFAEMNTLAGFLVVPACSDCGADDSDGEGSVLYVYRKSDKARNLFKVPVTFAFIDRFATSACANVDPVLGTTAEGFWYVTDLDDEMLGFFNNKPNLTQDGPLDVGNTRLWAAGFGNVSVGKDQKVAEPNPDLCDGPGYRIIPGCVTLECLSGQIVGLIEYSFVCGMPYQVLCSSDNDCVNDTQNAVLSGSWQIRRNKKMVSADMDDAEDKVLNKLPQYNPMWNDVYEK
jgi:hypothetical protein